MTQPPLNPYTAGNAIRDRQKFFGRDDTFKAVMQALRQPKNNAITLYGQRRIGKTSILLQLQQRLLEEGEFTPVLVDLQDKARKQLNQLLFEIAQTVSDAVGINRPDRRRFSGKQDYFRRKFLPAAANKAREGGLVLLFDEFDVLDDPEQGSAGYEFFQYLREWLNDIEQVKFVFIIGRRPEELTPKTLSTFKGVAAAHVWLFDRQVTELVVRQANVAGSLEWTDEAVERVWQLTQGHPFFTQSLCSVVWESKQAPDPNIVPAAHANDVDEAVPEMFQERASAFTWIWGGLPAAEKVVLAAMAEIDNDDSTEAELESVLSRSGVRRISRQLTIAPDTLADWGLLVQTPSGGYRFAVPVIKRWIKKNRPTHRVKDELDRLEPLAEKLFQVGQAYYDKDMFSEAEDELRRALRSNPNHLRAMQLLGRILLDTERVDEAVVVLEDAFDYDSRLARSDLIDALLAQADEVPEERKIEIYERILYMGSNKIAQVKLDALLKPRHEADLLLKRATSVLAHDNYQEASRLVQLALETKPGYEPALQLKIEIDAMSTHADDLIIASLEKLNEARLNEAVQILSQAPRNDKVEGLKLEIDKRSLQLKELVKMAYAAAETNRYERSLDAIAESLRLQYNYEPMLKLRAHILDDISRRADYIAKTVYDKLEMINLVEAVRLFNLLRRFGDEQEKSIAEENLFRLDRNTARNIAELSVRVQNALRNPDLAETERAELEEQVGSMIDGFRFVEFVSIGETAQLQRLKFELGKQRDFISRRDILIQRIESLFGIVKQAVGFDEAEHYLNQAREQLLFETGSEFLRNSSKILELVNGVERELARIVELHNLNDQYDKAMDEFRYKLRREDSFPPIDQIQSEHIREFSDDVNASLERALRLNRHLIGSDPQRRYASSRLQFSDGPKLEEESDWLNIQSQTLRVFSDGLQFSLRIVEEAMSSETATRELLFEPTSISQFVEAVRSLESVSRSFEKAAKALIDIEAKEITDYWNFSLQRMIVPLVQLFEQYKSSAISLKDDMESRRAKLEWLARKAELAYDRLKGNPFVDPKPALEYYRSILSIIPKNPMVADRVEELKQLYQRYLSLRQRLRWAGVGITILIALFLGYLLLQFAGIISR